MKSGLIINLITTHYSGNMSEFENALMALINDEEKKGNIPLATQLRTASKNIKKKGHRTAEPFYSGNPIISQGIYSMQPMVAPRDKDSLLELYEIINSDVKMEDVILPKEQKEALLQLIEEQRNKEILQQKNITPANRLLLCGPPGCGKTMTAKAVAGELGLPIAYVRLDGLVSSYLGQTGTNLRRVFDAVNSQRIALFLDEFDAIAKKRDDTQELGELKRVVTTLLQNFDNMSDNVFLIAATNHQHLLDPAIWRRFNTSIILNLPDVNQRKQLIVHWLKEYGIGTELNLEILSKITEGLNGAQVKELIIASVKHYLINGKINGKKINTDDIVGILLRQLSLYSSNSDEHLNILKQLNSQGVSIRTLERITRIPKSTLSYNLRIKEGKGNDG